MTLGPYIKRKRKEQQMTMTKLAQVCGVSLAFLHDLEKDRRQTQRLIPILATTLHLDADYLYYLAGRVPPDIQALDVPEVFIRETYRMLRQLGGSQRDI